MVKINIFFLLVLCLLTSSSHRVDGRHNTMKEDLELERQLKLINKPPVKSIYTKFGYIIDCVDINKQPAFDHPLLKNHKLQMRPNFHIKEEKSSVKIAPTKVTSGVDEVVCPTGTVPIRRTTKDELIRANDISSKVSLFSHVAEVALSKKYIEHYHGINGTTSIYNPKCTIAQASTSHIFIQSGEGDGTNKIIAGWHVFPHLYGDDRTYAYASWTTDNFQKTRCYNMKCLGFVQMSNQHHLGEVVPKTSVYDGPMVEMPISISQDPVTKNWWLSINNDRVGYFPAELFTNLKAGERAGWGGGTIAIDAPSPQMGSGLFPDENFYHAGYFRKISYQNESGSPYYGPDKFSVEKFNDVPKCYGVDYYEEQREPYGFSLQFGGPGGNCTA